MLSADIHEIDEPEFKIVIKEVIFDIFFEFFLLYLKLRQVFDYIWISLKLVCDELNELKLIRRKFSAVIADAVEDLEVFLDLNDSSLFGFNLDFCVARDI